GIGSGSRNAAFLATLAITILEGWRSCTDGLFVRFGMSDTKEFSRATGNLKLEVRPDFPADPRTTATLSPAVESTAVVEHPRELLNRELRAHERVRLLFRHWLSLVAGVSIGVGLVIAFQVKSNIDSVATTAPAAAIKV